MPPSRPAHHVRPRASLALALALALLALAVLPGGAAAAVDQAIVGETRDLLQHSVSSLSARSDSSDWRYFSNGLWINGDNSCWRCNVGPGTAAAVLASDGSHDGARSLAIQTMDRAIADHQRADGSFPDVSPGGSSPGVNTMFFAHQLGTAYGSLKDSLDPGRAERWRDSLTRAADFLIDRGEVTWYANGNLNLGYTEVLLQAWKATRLDRFQTAYDRSFEFTLNPPQDRWKGYGLRVTKEPTASDGSDGKGYLAEGSWTSGPGYDADYTQLQADIASRIWIESGDPRARRLLNLLVNQLLDSVDSEWQLDTSGGTRFPQQGRKVGFITPAVAILAWTAGRDDLAPLVRPHFDFIRRTFRESMMNGWWYYRLGTEPPTLLQAVHAATTSPPPPTSTPSPRIKGRAKKVADAVNRYRASVGRRSAQLDLPLSYTSQWAAGAITRRSEFGITLRGTAGPRPTVTSSVTRAGPTLVSITREGLDPTQIVRRLMRSPSAKSQLLGRGVESIGAARYGRVWVVRIKQ